MTQGDLQKTDVVKLNEDAISNVAKYVRPVLECTFMHLSLIQIHSRLLAETYTPWSWRDHSLHLVPPRSDSPDYNPLTDPRARATLDWIFLISSLNFSFWSELPEEKRFAVEWKEGWAENAPKARWTGYWCLVAALNKGE